MNYIRKKLGDVAHVDYVSTLTVAFIAAAAQTALIEKEYQLDAPKLLASLAFLTAANYGIGRLANFTVRKVTGMAHALFTNGYVQHMHLNDSGSMNCLIVPQR